jgi:predicted porin
MLSVFAPSLTRADDIGVVRVKLGGIFTQFLILTDDDEAPTEDLNPVGQFHYSRIYVDGRVNLSDSIYVSAYTRLVVNNVSSVNAEQAYVEVGSPYGQLRVGAQKPFNEQVVGKPAPQAALAVGDEIFSSMIKPRTDIPQRDGLTFKRFVSRALGVSYRTPRISGLQLGVTYFPATNSTEGPVNTSAQPSNAIDVTGSYKVGVMGGSLNVIGGYYRADSPFSDATGAKAWNTSLQWGDDRWQVGGTIHKARLRNGARDVAWAVGVLHRMGLWAFSTDYRSSNRRAAKGAPVGEFADRVMLQADYRLGPGINIGVAGFYSEQRDSNNIKWRGKGGTMGIKVFF